MALTQDTVLTFLLERGGQVRNSELLNCFRRQIDCGDPAGKQHNRDLFKRLVNSVAVVRQIDNVKFVIAKKRYRDFVNGLDVDGDRLRSEDAGADPNPSLWTNSSDQAESGDKDNTIDNHSDMHDLSSVQKSTAPPMSTNSPDTEKSLKILNISSDHHARRTGEISGAVFAVISVNSPPPRTPIRPYDFTSETYKTPEKPLPIKSLSQTAPALHRFCQTLERSRWSSTSQSCENIAELNGPAPPPAATRSQSTITTKKVDDPMRYSESTVVPLEPIAHEWLVKSGTGMWRHVYGLLLLDDTRLVNKRDFMSGFTALHWAAKGGNGAMVRKIMDISKSKGTCVDVDSKTHGGYTPLHLAAIHGHNDIIALLVQGYGARVNVRDNAGKKPYHYLQGSRVTAELKELLGGRQGRDHCRDLQAEEEEYRELPKSLNTTISKLFQPHIGQRKKHRHQQPPVGIWDGF